MFLEEFSEKALVGEVQILCNLLDTLRGVLQQYPQFKGHVVIDPFVGCATAGALDCFRQVLWRDVKLRGIPANTTLMTVILLNEFDEVGEDGVGTCMWFVIVLYPIDDVAQIVEHRQQQGLDQILAEMVSLIEDLLFDDLKVLLEGIYLLLFQTHNGVLTGEEEERTDVADVLNNLSEEMDRHHDA